MSKMFLGGVIINKKAVIFEQLEIVKNYIDSKDVLNIKSAEFVNDTIRLYASSDKSGEAVAEIALPDETFLDGKKTRLVSDFSWSTTEYPKSTNPELDGKTVLVLAVKSRRTVRYSFISLDSVIAKLVGGETESTSVSVADDVVTLSVKVSELSGNRIIMKDDGLYVGTVDNTPTWTVSTDDEVCEMFSLSDAPVYGEGTLGARNVGDIVQIMENDVPANFIVIQKGLPLARYDNSYSDRYDNSCDGVWLLREDALDKRKWNNEAINDYENSAINAYLNNDYFNMLDTNIKSVVKSAKIPYRKGSGATTNYQGGSDGLLCRVFLLGGSEVCGLDKDESTRYSDDEGVPLAYFYDAAETLTEASIKRVCNGSAGAPVDWWLRSPSWMYPTNVWMCAVNGSGSVYHKPIQEAGVRPAFILPYDVAVNADGLVL